MSFIGLSKQIRESGVTLPMLCILEAAKQPIRATLLADKIGVSGAAVTDQIQLLLRMELVTAERTSDDRRWIVVTTTTEGQSILAAAKAAFSATTRQATHHPVAP